MKLAAWASAAVTCALFSATGAVAQDQDDVGSVRLPLSRYEALTRRGGAEDGARYAFSDVAVAVTASEDGSAEVSVSASVRVIGEGVALVPLVSSGAALTRATANGRDAELVPQRGALAWPAEAGTHRVAWSYRVDARRYGDGRVISVATPSAAGRLTADLPGSDPGVTVIPASSVDVTASGDRTRVSASLPATGAVQIAWRVAGAGGYTLSRARYRGRLDGDTVRFEAELTVELAGGERVLVPLFPAGVALEDVQVDRAEAAIAVIEETGSFAVPVSGRGRHRVAATFSVPIRNGDGLPSIDLSLVPTPVCAFELRLPGERDVTVEPHAGVTTARSGGQSVASFHVPMSESVSIRWAEAVPEDAAEIETRASADLVHVVRPDEGVLSITAHASWEITRGASSRAELELPAGVQVNAVESSLGIVSDWRVAEAQGRRVLTVFLDRAVSERLELVVRYERPWPVASRARELVEVPLLRARGAHRQRGMIALLSSGGLTLEPREEVSVTRVGDNLLPPAVRDALSATVAHTFRYLDEPPRLAAVGAVRAPEPARFDAQLDTLVSLGDVSTSVATLVQLDIKSGALEELRVRLPASLSLLEVSAPSLRRYEVEGEGDERTLRIELTQPIEGRLTLEILSERITGQEDLLAVPFLGVIGAEVERGRAGIEARAAFQVDVATAERLSPVEPSELPEQLLLRTDNPILHAYRYAQASPAPVFAVRITRHAQIETLQATVDEASYRTLYTREGVAVTTARFLVQNRRQQFLRVTLPGGSEVWSARVDGRSQQPARETGSEDDAPVVLLNIVSAAEAFPVELVYATPAPRLGAFGRVQSALPELHVVVTRTRWEIFLPEGASYAAPETSMTLLDAGPAAGGAWALDGAPADLALEVPAEGVRYVFTSMYAGRSGEAGALSIPYVSGWGGPLALLLSALGALLLWLGLLASAVIRLGLPLPAALGARLPVALATYRDHRDAALPAPAVVKRTLAAVLGVSALGALLLAVAHGYLSTSAWPAVLVTVLVALGAIGIAVRHKLEARRAAPPAEPAAAAPPAG